MKDFIAAILDVCQRKEYTILAAPTQWRRIPKVHLGSSRLSSFLNSNIIVPVFSLTTSTIIVPVTFFSTTVIAKHCKELVKQIREFPNGNISLLPLSVFSNCFVTGLNCILYICKRCSRNFFEGRVAVNLENKFSCSILISQLN